jgi:DNA-binding IclR family transcriptional regulator
VPGTDASGRELSDRAVAVLEAVARNDGEATVEEIVQAVGDEAGAREELHQLVRSGHLAGPPRTDRAEGELSFGLLPAGRAALRLS